MRHIGPNKNPPIQNHSTDRIASQAGRRSNAEERVCARKFAFTGSNKNNHNHNVLPAMVVRDKHVRRPDCFVGLMCANHTHSCILYIRARNRGSVDVRASQRTTVDRTLRSASYAHTLTRRRLLAICSPHTTVMCSCAQRASVKPTTGRPSARQPHAYE